MLADWAAGRTPVVAATVAFGMGIDRAAVRLVAHCNLPKTLEAFYQASILFSSKRRCGMRASPHIRLPSKFLRMEAVGRARHRGMAQTEKRVLTDRNRTQARI